MLADTTWFDTAKFGMFVHFGLYSAPGGVWKGVKMGRNWYSEWLQMQADWPNGIPREEYRALAKTFNPQNFDADKWISLAKECGTKYFLITAKHHDGFALWDSKVSDYNVVKATPFGRDILRELKDACDRHNIVFGLYYSHWQDWDHFGGAKPPWPVQNELLRECDGDGNPIPLEPDMPQPTQEEFEIYWQEKCLPQVAELITHYDAKFFWFDSWCQAEHLTPKRVSELIDFCHNLNPNCLVNSRVGTTWNHPQGDEIADYLSMDDNQFPNQKISKKWETSGTFNHSWGYHKLDFNWQSSHKLLRHLIDNVSRNGNFQINCGPTGSGEIPMASYRRLKEVGAWLYANGEAIYGTKTIDCKEPAWGRLTCSANHKYIYAIVYENSLEHPLVIENFGAKPTNAEVLETGQTVEFDFNNSTLSIKMPSETMLTELNVIKITV